MRGRVRTRTGRAVAIALAAAATLIALGPAASAAAVRADGQVTESSSGEPHLPTVVNAPGTWSEAEGVEGPVAALGLATRTRIEDVFASRERLSVFAVSALDGSAAWLRLPGFSLDRWGYSAGFDVSPDGRWIGWVRPQRGRQPGSVRVAGWSVMDTTTGEVRRLEDPEHRTVRGTMADLQFSGDSRYLLTSYETPDQPRASRSRGHQLVAWDVEDGSSRVIEEPGNYWLPNLGSAPDGVVWARGREVFRADPVTGDRTSVTLPQRVVTASWGPDDTSFAYIGRPSVGSSGPWRLYAGRTVEQARDRDLPLPGKVRASELLGWRDPTHVVVGHSRRQVHVVDIVTGGVEELDLAGSGDQANAPYLAEGLWQQPLGTPVEPEGTTDPRRPWQWVSGAILALFAGALLVRRRRRRSRPATGALRDPTTPTGPLTPLGAAATGLILVLVDFRIQGFDLIPDPIGWVLAAVALCSLRPVHRGFTVAGVAAWLAVVPSLPDVVGVEHVLISSAIAVALLVIEVAACTAIIAVRPARAASASAIRWLSLALGGALVVAAAVAAAEPSTGILVLAIGLADLVVTLWFLVLLYGTAKAPTTPPREGALSQA